MVFLFQISNPTLRNDTIASSSGNSATRPSNPTTVSPLRKEYDALVGQALIYNDFVRMKGRGNPINAAPLPANATDEQLKAEIKSLKAKLGLSSPESKPKEAEKQKVGETGTGQTGAKPKKSDFGFWYSPEVKTGALDEQLLAYAKSMDEKSGGFAGVTVTDAKAKKYLDEAKSLMEKHGLLDENYQTIGMTKEQVLIMLTLVPLVMRGKEYVDKFFSKIEGKDVLGIANYIYDEKTGKSQFALENVSAKSQKLYTDLSATNFKRAESMATSQQPITAPQEASEGELAMLKNDANFLVANSICGYVDLSSEKPDLSAIAQFKKSDGTYDTEAMVKDAGANVAPIEAPALTEEQSAAIKSHNAATSILGALNDKHEQAIAQFGESYKMTLTVDKNLLASSLVEMGLLDANGAITDAGKAYLEEIGIDKERKQKHVLQAISAGAATNEAVRYMVARKMQDDLGKLDMVDAQSGSLKGKGELLSSINDGFFLRLSDAKAQGKAKKFTEGQFLSLGLARDNEGQAYSYASLISDAVTQVEASSKIITFASPLEAIAHDYANGGNLLTALSIKQADDVSNPGSLPMKEFLEGFVSFAQAQTGGQPVTSDDVRMLIDAYAPAKKEGASPEAAQGTGEQGGAQEVVLNTGLAWLDGSKAAQDLLKKESLGVQSLAVELIKENAANIPEGDPVLVVSSAITAIKAQLEAQ